MKKPLLNEEIAKMRKMMGLNEGPVSVNDYQSGENSYGDESTNFEDMFYKTLNGHEIESLEFEGVVYVDGRNKCVVSNGERITPSKEQLKDLWDEYVDSEGLYLEKANEGGDDANEDTVGIITSRGKLMPGYFEKFGLISAGDNMLFDKGGNVVLQGGGYPEGGFKEYTDPKELEKDICNNYEKIINSFRSHAPKTVQLNETYDVIKKSVECDLVYESLEEGSYEIDPTYTHFAVNNEDGKIYNGWEYDSDMDKASILYYCKIDLKDMDLNPKNFKIITKKYLLSSNIDPFDSNNWKNNN
jgi:hypothetical protein